MTAAYSTDTIERVVMRNNSVLLAVSVIIYILLAGNVFAAEVSGTVTDKKTGEEIPGAVIKVENTRIGAITNENGEYIIANAPDEEFTLIVVFTGYKPQKIQTSGGAVYFQLETAPFQTGEIVSTATGTEKIYEDVPVKTEVVTRKQIEAVQEPDLAGALSYTPGLWVENNCQNCNFTQLRMLGLEGSYSQILINGNPMMSTMAGVYGLQQFPEEMIDRIEVVKGGGSALYGGNAIGGVVDIKLRRPTVNRNSMKYNYRFRGSYIRKELGFLSEMVSEDMNYGMFLYGNTREQNHYDGNDDGFSDIGMLKGTTLGINMFYKPVEEGEFTFHLHRIHEDRRGGNRLNFPSHDADISEAIESYRWGGNLKYIHNVSSKLGLEGNYAFALAERNTYYGAERDPNAYGRTDNPLHYLSAKANYHAGINLITAGVTYKAEDLFDEAIAYSRIIDDNYENFGVFIQDEIDISNRYHIVGGLRVDKNSLLDDPILSPRISALVDLTENLSLRGNASTGFKAPQVFDEDLHITQVGGEGQIIRNGDDLKEEKSVSFSGTVEITHEFGPQFMQAGITGFHTVLDDQFQVVERDDPATEEQEFTRINGDGLQVSGVEFQAGYRPLESLEIQGGLTLQTDELDSKEEDFGTTRIFKTPEQYASLIVYFDPIDRLSLFGGVNYTGEMKVPHYAGYISDDVLESTDAFFSLDVGLSYKFMFLGDGKGWQKINIGIKNITDEFQDDLDKGVDRDAGYVYGPMTPRMVYMGMDIGF